VPEPELTAEAREEARRGLAAVRRPLRAGDFAAAAAAADDLDGWAERLPDALTRSRLLYQVAEMLDDAGLRHAAARRNER
jgi:hypothetical protein